MIMSISFPKDSTLSEAIQIQKELRRNVNTEKFKGKIKFIAGADVSFNKFEEDVYAGIIVLSYPELKIVDYSVIKSVAKFPYIPGLLSFREIPALLLDYQKLKTKPDLVMVDGQGICHPRRLGIATHFGLVVDLPTIGAAKSLLTGTFEPPEPKRGNFSYIYDRSSRTEKIGAAVITKNNVKPMIVSPGNKINLEQSIDLILKCALKHRMPEPTRQAHLLVNKFRRGEIKEGQDLSSPLQDPLF